MRPERIAPFWYYVLFAFVFIYWGGYIIVACKRGDIPACAEAQERRER